MQGQLGTLGKAEYPNADGGVFIDMNIGDAAAQQVLRNKGNMGRADYDRPDDTAWSHTCAPLVSIACSEIPLWGRLLPGPATEA